MTAVLTQQQIVEQMMNIALILGKQKKMSGAKQCVTDFFTLFNQFHEITPQESYELATKLNEIRGLTESEQEYLQLYSENLLDILKKINARMESTLAPAINYIKATKKLYADSYKRDREKYVAFIDQIENTENKVMTSPLYERKYHEALFAGKHKGFLHARINQNLRILYVVKGDNATFWHIVTKDEMERS
ncbi:MAG TPA: hypothetical protein VJJ82_00355 [Candidatus Nanoarchaeia archaeon]|nr:hypothetical protein [Candidatus Nanoarchaeia archaeon]